MTKWLNVWLDPLGWLLWGGRLKFSNWGVFEGGNYQMEKECGGWLEQYRPGPHCHFRKHHPHHYPHYPQHSSSFFLPFLVSVLRHQCLFHSSLPLSAESKEVYKRQVLSITSIAVGISLLGMLCMALYCRNKWVLEKPLLTHSETEPADMQ